MVEEEGSTAKNELDSSLPPPPPSALPSSPPATLASRDSETKIPPTSTPLRPSSSSSSHLLDLPLLPDPLLGDRLHAAELDLAEEHESDAGLASEMVNQENQQNPSHGTPVPSTSSHPLNNSLPALQSDDLHSTSSTTLDAPAAPPPPQDGHDVESGNGTVDPGREGALEQSPDVWVEIEVGSGGGEEEGQVDVDEVGGGDEGEVEAAAAVESTLLLEDTGQDLEATNSSQLHQHSSSQDLSPLESPKTASNFEDPGSRSSRGSASNDSQPLPSSFNSTSSNVRASSAPPDLPSKKDLHSVTPNPRSSSLPTVFILRRAASRIEDRVEASPAGSVVVEEHGSQDAEQDRKLRSGEEEDAYIDASSSQAVTLQVEPINNSDEDAEESRDDEDEDPDVEEEQKEKDKDEDEMEIEEGSQSAGSFTDDRTSSFDLPSSPGPSSSSSSKRKDPPSPSPTSSSRQTAPPVAKRPKQSFRSPMILSSPGRPSPSLLPSTSSSNDLRRPSASSPPPSPPPPPPPPKPKRPKSTFKALTVSLPPPPPPPSAAASRKPSSSSTNAPKSPPPPPSKRKKAPVVPFQSPMGGGGGSGSGGSTGFSQAKEIAETERKVQMLKQALRFVGTAEGRRKEERERELVEKWKVAGREISQLLWDETPSSRDPSKDANNNNNSNSSNPSSSPFSFADDQPFGFSTSSSSAQQPSPFLSSSSTFEPHFFETSFGFSSTTAPSSSFDFDHNASMDDPLELEPDSDSSLPSPKTVSRQIDQTLAKRANGGRVGLGVRAYLEDRRERMGSGSRSIVEEVDEDGEENGDGDDEHDEKKQEQREQERKRKRQAEAWNVGEMLRRRFGVDPVLFGWDNECEDWI